MLNKIICLSVSSRELTQPKHRLIGQLAGPSMNYATPPVRILLQLSRDNLLHVNTVYHSQWRNWGGRGANCPLGKLILKTGLPLNLYFGFSILLVFSTLLCVFRIIFQWFRIL